MDLAFLLYWHTEHDTYKIVSIQIIRAIVCDIVKKGTDILECFTKLLDHRIVNIKKNRL